MNIFDKYTHDLLSELNTNGVEYLVVGGYAVNFHGYLRTTGDIDLWIGPDNTTNKEKILKSLKNLKVDDEVINQLNVLDFSKPVVFIDGEPPYKIDFMTYVSGVNFVEAWKQKSIVTLDDLKIPFIHLDHLIISKFSTGRSKDKIDIDELQKIQKVKNRK